MTRLIFHITDVYHNPLPYAIKIVNFDVEGPAELVGENPFPLVGGQAALYIKAQRQAGQVTVFANTSGLPRASLSIEIIPPISNTHSPSL